MSSLSRAALSSVVTVSVWGLALTCLAQTPAPSFSDVPALHPAFAAVEELKVRNILQGYADGTFKPDNKINRAETLKIIVANLVPASALESFKGKSVYTDVAADLWFAPYVEAARSKLAIIDGPPKTTTFSGTRPVKSVEFLKMMLLGNKIDPHGTYGEIKLPLSTDVTNTDEWYYPYMRFAIASSMIIVGPEGQLAPARELTRGDLAVYLYRFLMYREGRRTQALLSEAETEILNVLKMLEQKDIVQAEFASARALIASRGALTSKPDEPIVKGAVKTAEGFHALVRAYRAGTEGRLNDVITLAGDAWHLAEKAREFSPNLDTIAVQMQTVAKNMADEARAMQAKAENPQ